MRQFDRNDAVLLATTELLPGEWRDLSDLLLEQADQLLRPEPRLGRRSAWKDELADFLAQNLDPSRVAVWEKRLAALAAERPGLQMITVTDPRYPSNLFSAYDRPPFLFVEGAIEARDERAVAIVGSRSASREALAASTAIADAAIKMGITVVSGLARGVDAVAHRAALGAGGRTIAVLGTGIDRVYPVEHASLALEIATHGAVVSQFRPGSPPAKSTFPMRNAVISGLSAVSVLVEATERSGTRSEADHALRQGRLVLLWEPILGAEPWAQRFATTPGVRWLSNPEDISAVIDSRAPQPLHTR
jgi:DNA processing protein